MTSDLLMSPNLASFVFIALGVLLVLDRLLASGEAESAEGIRAAQPAPAIGTSWTVIFLLSTTVSLILYTVFWRLARFVWSFSPDIPEREIVWFLVPFCNETGGKDGIEIYVLYAILLVALAMGWQLHRLVLKASSARLQYAIIAALCAASVWFSMQVGFIPPWTRPLPVPWDTKDAVRVTLAALAICGLVTYAERKSAWLSLAMVAALLVPVCFVAITPIAFPDYEYLFTPALRLLHGCHPSDVYMQYDLMLTLLAAGWMKLKLDLFHFVIITDLSVYTFMLGLFLFSRRVFHDRRMAILLVMVTLICRSYVSLGGTPGLMFQVSPLRLDWWLVLVVLVWSRGAYHWSAGLTLGLLLVFHRNFGVIYLLSYAQFALVLFGIELADGARTGVPIFGRIKQLLPKHARFLLPNGALIALGLLVSRVVLGGMGEASMFLYQGLSIGFMRISPRSFYWYVPAVLTFVFIVTLTLRKALDERYRHTVLLSVLLAIGCSTYYFGRSHEDNMVNLAGILLFVLFLAMDLGNHVPTGARRSTWKRAVARAAPFGVALFVVVTYSPLIASRIREQYEAVRRGTWVKTEYWAWKDRRHVKFPAFSFDFSRVRQITRNSGKVYFLGRDTALFYYRGGYAPAGYFHYTAFVFKADAARFLQGLLDAGYYLVDTAGELEKPDLPLEFNQQAREAAFSVVWKEPPGHARVP